LRLQILAEVSRHSAVSFIESAPLSPTDRAKIAHANAERIFKIAPGPSATAPEK
jgi:predicted TIM-barrel fold metal-dependent hydrolase